MTHSNTIYKHTVDSSDYISGANQTIFMKFVSPTYFTRKNDLKPC